MADILAARARELIQRKKFEEAHDELILQINLQVAAGNKTTMLELYKILLELDQTDQPGIYSCWYHQDLVSASNIIRRYKWSKSDPIIDFILKKALESYLVKGMFGNAYTTAEFMSKMYMDLGRIQEARDLFNQTANYGSCTGTNYARRQWESRLISLENGDDPNIVTPVAAAVASSSSATRDGAPLIDESKFAGVDLPASGISLAALKDMVQRMYKNTEQQMKDIQALQKILEQQEKTIAVNHTP